MPKIKGLSPKFCHRSRTRQFHSFQSQNYRRTNCMRVMSVSVPHLRLTSESTSSISCRLQLTSSNRVSKIQSPSMMRLSLPSSIPIQNFLTKWVCEPSSSRPISNCKLVIHMPQLQPCKGTSLRQLELLRHNNTTPSKVHSMATLTTNRY